MVKLKRVYEYWCFESEKDKEDLKNHLGDALFDDYMKIRDRIPKSQNDYKDFQKLKKLPIKDVQDFVSSFQSKSDKKKSDKQKGAEKIFEDSDWVVYRITTYPAAQLYGKGTKWCITGRYPGHEGRGEEYFNDYIEDNNLDGGYYFYINKKDPKEKYCVLQTKDKEIHSIWDAEDENQGVSLDDLPDDVILPEVKGINIRPFSIEQLCRAIDNYSYPSDILYKMIDSLDVEDLNKYYRNETPLFYAIESPRKDSFTIIKKLLEKGVNVNLRSKDVQGNYPISVATRDPEILELLVYNSIGINIDIQDKEGLTPLFYASCVYNNYDSAKLLLEAGANPNFRDNNDDTPLSIAKENGDKKMIELLKKYGAKE